MPRKKIFCNVDQKLSVAARQFYNLNHGNKMSETAGLLRAWAETEMGYSGTVSAENLSSVCRGSMKNVWGWMISHCLDRERVKTIKGNLILMKKKVEGKLV